jgi:hypothetical protein
MTSSENDPLLHHLLELVKDLDNDNISIILGGGMSLYLRLKFMAPRSHRYPFDIQIRSTDDLDLFLSSRLISDLSGIKGLKQVLTRLGYQVLPEAKNFQFFKQITIFGQPRTVKVDLLAAPPDVADQSKVEIKKPRIKPKGAEGIHAFLTPEALGIDIGKQPVDIKKLGSRLRIKNQVLFIPSAYNYLILKLHAFEDRKNRDDKASYFGRHHAFDIFATVARMGEPDWKIAMEHFDMHKNEDYMKKSVEIRKNNFSRLLDIGLLRLRENEGYRVNQKIYDTYLDLFIKDLLDLFPN